MSINKKSLACKGLTLIEMLIVISIVGIITAVAYPQYVQYSLKAGRSEGAAALLNLMERQESYYRDELKYTSKLTDLGYASNTYESKTGRYQLRAERCTSGNTKLTRCVLLTAVPQNAQAADKTGVMTLNSRGAKSANWID